MRQGPSPSPGIEALLTCAVLSPATYQITLLVPASLTGCKPHAQGSFPPRAFAHTGPCAWEALPPLLFEPNQIFTILQNSKQMVPLLGRIPPITPLAPPHTHTHAHAHRHKLCAEQGVFSDLLSLSLLIMSQSEAP